MIIAENVLAGVNVRNELVRVTGPPDSPAAVAATS
jgi:hypothetical protein